jgi:hypothetical protein
MIAICHDHAANVKRWQDGTWRCAGSPPGWSRPKSSSAASTANPTCRPFGRRCRPRSPSLSPVRARIMRRWKRLDDHRDRHRSSTELGTSSSSRLGGG